MLEEMQVRTPALNTHKACVRQVTQFANHPGAIRTYQVDLAQERQLAPKSTGLAVAALRLLCKVSSQRE